MTRRVVTTRELNRTVLERQMLLERSSGDIAAAVEQMGALQMQYAPSGYIGLWSRLEGFDRALLTSALERRDLVQATIMRATIHLASVRDYVLFTAGVRRARREWWLRTAQPEDVDFEAVADRIRELLADGPLRPKEIMAGLEDVGGRAAWAGAGMFVDLVRVPPSGTWERRRADLYGLAGQWLGVDLDATSEDEGLEHLVRRYLGAFGPAAMADIATWAGVPVLALTPVLLRLDLRRYRGEDGRELLDLPDLPIADPDTPAPVRFLPTWDAILLVHARRAAVLPERFRPLIFNTRMPQSTATFMVDGAVAGAWHHDGERVVVEPYEPLPPAVQREVDEEEERLTTLYG